MAAFAHDRAACPQTRYTEAEYFALEAVSPTKNEFYRGEIFAMASTSFDHVQIVTNLIGVLLNRLAGKPCRPLSSDLRVKVGTAEFITYSDVTVLCGPPDLVLHPQGEAMTNPSVLFEVLSDSTEAYDRGKKFALYRQLPSLRAYVLVAQDEALVEVLTWEPRVIHTREYRGLDQTAELPALAISLPLAEVYRDVEFSPRIQMLETERRTTG